MFNLMMLFNIYNYWGSLLTLWEASGLQRIGATQPSFTDCPCFSFGLCILAHFPSDVVEHNLFKWTVSSHVDCIQIVDAV